MTLIGCVHELEKLEESVTGLRSQLDRAIDRQRRFAADVSHELRTPVAGLRAQLEEAQLNPGETDLNGLIDRALRDVDRLQAIITDLHLLAQLEASTTPSPRERVDLAELVQSVVSRRVDIRQVKLQLERGVVVSAVPAKISRALIELLDNAQRHAKRTVQVWVRRIDDTAEMAVADDGEGITLPDRERIFERFARLDEARCRDRGGTGLGLPIVRAVATAHQGTVGVEDSPIGGAAFVIHLPLADVSAPASPTPVPGGYDATSFTPSS
ncbi:sensor histidine kinase [Planotetraspora sp. GP83]|uniref:sensor histidine kinase n=1 Tax=Planotetraspora sp. GP83 TaxID=3156264 RepID=UPI0035196E65